MQHPEQALHKAMAHWPLGPVTVMLLGEPVAFARTRGVNRFTPKKQRNAAAVLKMLAQQEMLGRPIFDEALRVHFLAEMAIASTWSKKKRAAALLGEILPTKKPDLSNQLKLVEDALNGVVYRDDCLIVEFAARKIFGVQPKIVITVTPAIWRGEDWPS